MAVLRLWRIGHRLTVVRIDRHGVGLGARCGSWIVRIVCGCISWVGRISRCRWRGSPFATAVLRDKLLMHLFERDEARIFPRAGILEVLSIRQWALCSNLASQEMKRAVAE